MRKLIVALWLMPGLANAFDCNQRINDEARVFNNSASVETAAQQLEQVGALVRVVTTQRHGQANLDRYADKLYNQCPAWHTGNVVIVAMSLDERDLGLYYGDSWKATLDPNQSWLREGMKPYFRNHDFAGGFTYALGEVNRLLYAAQHPPVEAPPTQTYQQQPYQAPQQSLPEAPVQNYVPPMRTQNTRPTDYSGLILMIQILAAMGVLSLGIYGLVSYRRALAARDAAQKTAIQNQQSCFGHTVAVRSEIENCRNYLRDHRVAMTDTDADTLTTRLNQAEALSDQATINQDELLDAGEDPQRPECTTVQYETMGQKWSALTATLNEASGIINSIRSAIDIAVGHMTDFPRARTDSYNEILRSAQILKAISDQGFKTDVAATRLEQAQQKLDAAIKLTESRDFKGAFELIRECTLLWSDSRQIAQNLPTRQQKLLADIKATELRANNDLILVNNTRPVFEGIATDFAQSCWQSVAGNGTEAERRLKQVGELLTSATHNSNMAVQNWDQAEQDLQTSAKLLDEIESLMRSITALKSNLDAARRDAPQELAALENDLRAASAYVQQYDADISDERNLELHQAAADLSACTDEFREQQPDYLKLVRMLREAHDLVDRTLQRARSEHEAMERKRAKAQSALRDARAAVSMSKEYIEDHRSDVGSHARTLLQDAGSLLQQALTASTLDDQIRLAEAADKRGDEALRQAKRDFSEAEDEREAARRANAAIIASMTNSSRSILGGGSSRWGSRGGGLSGGSSKW